MKTFNKDHKQTRHSTCFDIMNLLTLLWTICVRHSAVRLKKIESKIKRYYRKNATSTALTIMANLRL